MTTAYIASAPSHSDSEPSWDGRPSGFQGIKPGPLLVFIGWAVGLALWVRFLSTVPGHTPQEGLGVSGFWMFVYLFVMGHLVLMGVGMIYHRILTHRACWLSPLVLYPMLIASLPAGTPIQWVGNHRHHHGKTDKAPDWHSPIHGFWAAHAGWYIYTRNPFICALYSFSGPLRMLFDAFWRPQTNQEYVRQARDVAAVPFYAFVSRPTPFAFFVIGHVALSWGFAYWLWGTSAFIALFVTQVIYYIVGDGVNSFLHVWGHQPFRTNDDSRNMPVAAFFMFGEGYHNAHHALPRSMRTGLLPGQVDVIYSFARLLERLSLCRDIVVPTPKEILGRLNDERYRKHFEQQLPAASV